VCLQRERSEMSMEQGVRFQVSNSLQHTDLENGDYHADLEDYSWSLACNYGEVRDWIEACKKRGHKVIGVWQKDPEGESIMNRGMGGSCFNTANKTDWGRTQRITLWMKEETKPEWWTWEEPYDGDDDDN